MSGSCCREHGVLVQSPRAESKRQSLVCFDEIKERYLDMIGDTDMRQSLFHFDERNLEFFCLSFYDGVVVWVGASQDQFRFGINNNFVVVFEESEEHFEWNIDIKIVISVGLPSRFLRMAPARVFERVCFTGCETGVPFHQCGRTDICASVNFDAIQFMP